MYGNYYVYIYIYKVHPRYPGCFIEPNNSNDPLPERVDDA